MPEKQTGTVNRRLEALKAYAILDTPAEKAFDDLTQLARYICDAPISLITLLDNSRQWFKSKSGLDISETPIEQAFCAHAIKSTDVFIVTDATTDPRFSANPLVTSEPHIRFYAGAPLITPEGVTLGTLCTIDRKPRSLSADQCEALSALARQVVALLELRRTVSLLTQALEQKNAALAEVETLQGLLPICSYCKKVRGDEDYWHEVDSYFSKRSNINFTHGICPECYETVLQDLNESQKPIAKP